MVEKELDIRRRILRDYNKKVRTATKPEVLSYVFLMQEEDFDSLETYNTYLEEIEEIIFNLTHNIEILETNKRIEAYKKEHREQIRATARSGRLGKDEVEIEILLEQEKEMVEMRNQVLGNLVDLSKKKTNDKEKLIDELMFSSENAHSILKTYASKVEETKKEQDLMAPPPQKITKFSSGINFSTNFQQQYLPVPKIDDGPTYVYEEPVFALHNGPAVPSFQEIETRKYSKHIRTENQVERAGGFQSKISCYRALQEAMQGLYPFVIQ